MTRTQSNIGLSNWFLTKDHFYHPRKISNVHHQKLEPIYLQLTGHSEVLAKYNGCQFKKQLNRVARSNKRPET